VFYVSNSPVQTICNHQLSVKEEEIDLLDLLEKKNNMTQITRFKCSFFHFSIDFNVFFLSIIIQMIVNIINKLEIELNII
jgi:hypothetical protein